MLDTLPEALADALGKVIADQRKQWERDLDLLRADGRVLIAELREQNAVLIAQMKEMAGQQFERVSTAIAGITNGKDADPVVMERMINERVNSAFAAMPVPKDGESVTVEQLLPTVREVVTSALSSLQEIVETAVDVSVKALPPAEPGKDADPAETERMVKEAVADLRVDEIVDVRVAAAVKEIRVPQDGKDADPEEVARMVDDAVAKAAAALPVPKDGEDGKSVDMVELKQIVVEVAKDIIAEIPVPRDGKDVDMAAVGTMIREVIASIPVPRDGKDVDMAQVKEMIAEEVRKIPVPENGRDVDMVEVKAMITEAVAAIPVPKDGEDGKDVDMEVVKEFLAAAVKALPLPKDVDMEEVKVFLASEIQNAAAAIPLPSADEIKTHITEEVKRCMPAPIQGKSVTVEDVRPMLEEMVAALPEPLPGKDADMVEVERMVGERVSAVVGERLPASVTEAVEKATAGLPDVIIDLVQKTVDEAPKPRDGVDVDMAQVLDRVDTAVAKTLETWDRPKDGESVTLEQVEPIIAQAVEAAAKQIPVPKDGAGLADAIIDRDHNLILTMTDGRTKNMGRIVGTDGKSVELGDVVALIKEEVAKFPVPKDGVDGVGFDDMELTFDGERTFVFTFTKGDLVKEAKIKTGLPVHRGFWQEEKTYEPGDVVSFWGNSYIAKVETKARPDDPNIWGLLAKRGLAGESKEEKAAQPPKPAKLK